MKIGVLGTGMVGEAIGSKLVAIGHDVMMGSRTAQQPKAVAWVRRTGALAATGRFEDTADFGEVVFNCTHGAHSIEVLRQAGADRLSDKILIDVANTLPPDASSAESLGERIQKAFPRTKVVKTLNTTNCDVMVNPSRLRDVHTMFMCGNDAGAKATVRRLLESFEWKDIVDIGDITNARATEQYLPLWLALWKQLGTTLFNIRVVR